MNSLFTWLKSLKVAIFENSDFLLFDIKHAPAWQLAIIVVCFAVGVTVFYWLFERVALRVFSITQQVYRLWYRRRLRMMEQKQL